MVECELNSGTDTTTKSYSFNRYMVECEFNFSGKMAQMSTVLIDTWWNVNVAYTASRHTILKF